MPPAELFGIAHRGNGLQDIRLLLGAHGERPQHHRSAEQRTSAPIAVGGVHEESTPHDAPLDAERSERLSWRPLGCDTVRRCGTVS